LAGRDRERSRPADQPPRVRSTDQTTGRHSADQTTDGRMKGPPGRVYVVV